jgi:hypothetical protein
VQPVRKAVRVAQRVCSPRQDEEHRLERVLGELAVSQKLKADAEHHRPVPADKRGERGLSRGVTGRCEPIEKLTVAHAGDRATGKKRLDLSCHGTNCRACHLLELDTKGGLLRSSRRDTAHEPRILSNTGSESCQTALPLLWLTGDSGKVLETALSRLSIDFSITPLLFLCVG